MFNTTNIRQIKSSNSSIVLFAILPISIISACVDNDKAIATSHTEPIEYELVESNPKDTYLYDVRDWLKGATIYFDIIRFEIAHVKNDPTPKFTATPDTITITRYDHLYELRKRILVYEIIQFDSMALSFSYSTFICAYSNRGLRSIAFHDWNQDFFQDIPSEELTDNEFSGINIPLDSLKESKNIKYDELIAEASKYRFDSISSWGDELSKYDSSEINNQLRCFVAQFTYTFEMFEGNKMYRRVLRINDPIYDRINTKY